MGLEIRTSRLPELLKLRTSILSFQHNIGTCEAGLPIRRPALLLGFHYLE